MRSIVCFPPYLSDIDECAQNPCHDNASCINSIGSYECHCDSGFSGNGKNCTSKYEKKESIESLRHFVTPCYILLQRIL